MTASPIAPVASLVDLTAAPAPAAAPRPGIFGLMLNGAEQVNATVLQAEQMAQAFAVDDTVPLHQVTFALEQARLATELMVQVRSRLLEGYQDIMRMQI